MISATQREALGVLSELCELSADMRLGQLLAWIGDIGEFEAGRKLGDIEDEELLAVLYHHRAQLIARLPDSRKQALRLSDSVPVAQVTPITGVAESEAQP